MEICSKDFSRRSHETLNNIIKNKLWSYECRQKIARDIMSVIINHIHKEENDRPINEIIDTVANDLLESRNNKFFSEISNHLDSEKSKIVSLYKNSSKQASYISQCGIVPPQGNIDSEYFTNVLLNNYPMHPINIL